MSFQARIGGEWVDWRRAAEFLLRGVRSAEPVFPSGMASVPEIGSTSRFAAKPKNLRRDDAGEK